MSGDPEGSGRFQVRAYRPEDRAVIRRICADTGFLGKPIDPVFEDRELFADFLTAPYTDATNTPRVIICATCPKTAAGCSWQAVI